MVSSVGITDTIKSLSDLQTRCNLRQAEDERFFSEWIEDLPQLNQQEQAGVTRIKQRYDYHRVDGLLLEGTINLLVVSPLLELAGFLDPPYRIRSPYGIALEIEEPEETIRGFIDTLVVQEKLWIFVVESKRNSIPVLAALPQLLAYMLTTTQTDKPVFGMATNGDEFIFLKLTLSDTPQYDVSRTFSLFPRRHELAEVLQILKRLGQAALK
ncbi:type I restriction endonuclease subunit R [Cylindrospermum sp. FACHB-282]|uniref:type I restriction endonuclease subunit R n=1 Tax=Cylindrospermum sp. FACHB-282 TaxID=2692794 RepID=UPI001684ADC3|nr:type I restriction endonuclease subunit R [Cylindrospermum sp. FACHB-282]MBD2386309.1 type I restriction endonuclease subunit R [Cylindrospermum sp. FACHB-282]